MVRKSEGASAEPNDFFQPLPFSRYGTSLVFGLIPFSLLLDPPQGEPFTWILFTGLFEWLAWRGLWVGAVVNARQVVVRGYFWDRTISRRSITGVTDYPSLIWTDAHGQTRKSPVHALAYSPYALTAITRASTAQGQRLRQVLGYDPRGRKRKRRR